MSEDKLSQMVSRADKDSTGYISEDDFLEAFDWLMSQGQDERDYMAIFNMLVSEPGFEGGMLHTAKALLLRPKEMFTFRCSPC